MIRRFIAALVVATLCWLSVPLSFGGASASAMQQMVRDASNQDHSCCPGLHPRIAPLLLLINISPAMPCGEQNPCCARRVPSNPSTAPVEAKVVRPSTERAVVRTENQLLTISRRAVEASFEYFLPPPFERSTVLRN